MPYRTVNGFALLFHEQKKQQKLIKYRSVIGYLLGNPLGFVDRRLSFQKTFRKSLVI